MNKKILCLRKQNPVILAVVIDLNVVQIQLLNIKNYGSSLGSFDFLQDLKVKIGFIFSIILKNQLKYMKKIKN